ncbi:MAG TPA: NPCBM/NEW2 domain-containing protein [Pyrinomonadaceae bacterium]|nr:NPCBM/NEW2 domain-containing protein [Pyrinomonadaceae bacterium]
MYLDSVKLLGRQVGYGDLGMNGSLGYEGRQVRVGKQYYNHAFSTHPPARLRFHVERRFASFTCQVALNDDVPAGWSHADFSVVADGREVANEPYVQAGEPPRPLVADISGAEYLELVVRTSRWEHSHAVWLDPQVDETRASIAHLFDSLNRAELIVPERLPRTERCIATVVSPGFEHLLDDMLGSLYANGCVNDALVVVFVLNGNDACNRVIAKYKATPVRCQSRAGLNPMSKAVMYSAARVVDAKHYLCLDADMVVLGDLRPIFATLEALPEGRILACREGNTQYANHLGSAIDSIYGGGEADLRQLEVTPAEQSYSLVVNDGLYAGDQTALRALDGAIRAMPQACAWVDGHSRVKWRNQFIFNLALARLQCGVELDSIYNVQLQAQDIHFYEQGSRLRATWRGREPRVLHFNGGAKRKYPQWQGKFSSIADPLAGQMGGDNYATFVETLRAWVGRQGVKALAWSFYGLTNGQNAAVRDPSVLPLLATLHYLIRANGCVRVLETGTARGISAACLASAVAHREGGRVVTLDPFLFAGREDLWAMLPESFQSCIEARRVGSLEGMKAALDAGEVYEAVLLDSVHEAEFVWAEFQLAAELVCPGGLILIHDATYALGTVPMTLARIEAAGYNVVRLWAAEGGTAEDDHLGLAVIENRRRAAQVVVYPQITQNDLQEIRS